MPIHESSRPEREEVLRLLREIKRSPALTQRELSNRLGISLGKVNFLLKALILRGLVTAHNFKNSHNKKAYLYILTPHGLEEKTQVTCRFLKRKLKEYERLESEIKLLRQEIRDLGVSADTEDRQ